MTDPLTNLESYDIFVEQLRKEMDNVGNDVLSIVYFDLKHFKSFNDNYGYSMGNKLLARIGEMLRDKRTGFVCGSRVISDNIVFALREKKRKSLEDLYAKMLTLADSMEEKLQEEFDCRKINISAGIFFITSYNKDISIERAISNANLARKKAKSVGKRPVEFFTEDMATSIDRRLEIIASVEGAITDHELKAYYQPKVESATGKVVGAEALVRWEKKDGTRIYPEEFIPIIESSHQVIDVDYYIYNEVFRFLSERIAKNKKVLPISMNVSRQHLTELGILHYIRGLRAKYGVPVEFLEFELTETICMEDQDKVMMFIDALHSMGVKVSMDDFGSGYSSLNMLSIFPLDTIKMDKCFFHSNSLNSKEKAIIKNLINMLNQLGMKTLCEGVETKEQSDFLRESGCAVQQGYYYYKPVSREEFENILDKNA